MNKFAQILESDIDSLIYQLLGKAVPSSSESVETDTEANKIDESYQLPVKHTKGGKDIDEDNKPWVVGTYLPGQYINVTHIQGHEGIDLKSDRGSPIYPIASGIVTEARDYPKGGKTVKVSHEDGKVVSYYAHMDVVHVSPGQEVTQSSVIGNMGDTGNAKGRGAHLHYEVKIEGKKIDPQSITGKRVGSLSKRAEFIANIIKGLDDMVGRKGSLKDIIDYLKKSS